MSWRGAQSARWGMGGVLLALVAAASAWWGRPGAEVDPATVAVVTRASLTARITATGTLRPIQSFTYRSPILGRETEIVELVAEGTRVAAGDVLVRLDDTEVRRELERVLQERRQAELDVEVAESELEEAAASVASVTQGSGALEVAEAKARVEAAERRQVRLAHEFEQLQGLLTRGYITREELSRTEAELEESTQDLTLVRRRADIVEQMTHPREERKAALQFVQRQSQVDRADARRAEIDARIAQLRALTEACTIRARSGGLVVYEEFLSVSPRRKLRVGDRVTPSQGIVTIPEVARMLVDATVSEADVERVRPGQLATVRAEAFASTPLSGRVSRVGAMASASVYRPLDDKRFDLVIALDPTGVDLRPEMTVRADIALGTRDQVLVVPAHAVFAERGGLVAHVVGPRGVETRPVTAGESNELEVEIVSGLSEGERVLLIDPRLDTAGARSTGSAWPASGVGQSTATGAGAPAQALTTAAAGGVRGTGR